MNSVEEAAATPATCPRTICSRYRLESLIGSGSMGMVYQAIDEQTGQTCAVKLLRAHSPNRDQLIHRFLDEARIISRLYHPNIVEIFDHGEEQDGTLFLTMELLQGRDLHSLLQVEGRLPLGQTLSIARQIGSALHMVHLAGVVHRDIKPRNIFLVEPTSDSEQQHVKVIDFGLAKLLKPLAANQNSDGLLIGTPEYLPPEAWSGISAEVDGRADQWALAVLLYRMLSGQLPFDQGNNTVSLAREILSATPQPLRQILPEVPEYVEAALQRALSKEKEKRFHCIAEFVRALCNRPQALVCDRPRFEPEKLTVLLEPDPVSNHPTEPISLLSMQTTRILTPPPDNGAHGANGASQETRRAGTARISTINLSETTNLSIWPRRSSRSLRSFEVPVLRGKREWLPFSMSLVAALLAWAPVVGGQLRRSAASMRPVASSRVQPATAGLSPQASVAPAPLLAPSPRCRGVDLSDEPAPAGEGCTPPPLAVDVVAGERGPTGLR